MTKWSKFNNLGLAIGTNLQFYTSVAKGLKLKVRKFWGLIRTFVEVTGEKLDRVKIKFIEFNSSRPFFKALCYFI